MNILLIDYLDSFTFNLSHYVKMMGMNCETVRNSDEKLIEKCQKADAIILSPGPGNPIDTKNLLSIIEKFYLQKPILGICLGHQALGIFFGANLIQMKYPMHGKVSKIFWKENYMSENLPKEMDVCRYHSLVLENISTCLEVVANTSQNEVMAFVHKSLPIVGIQFHPEAILTQFGKEIINNWLKHIIF